VRIPNPDASLFGYPRPVQFVENAAKVLRRNAVEWAFPYFVTDVDVVRKRLHVVVGSTVESDDLVPLPVVRVLLVRNPDIEEGAVSEEYPEVFGCITRFALYSSTFDEIGKLGKGKTL